MISVIVPTLDEEHLLPRCLDAVIPQLRPGEAELLVVDGGSRDRTAAIAAARGARVLVVTPPGRGRQMNAGACAAQGSLLLFLPADTILPEGALGAVARFARGTDGVAGGFCQRFDRNRRVLAVVSALHNLRARWSGVVYGDQVPFVRRDAFEATGGFREDIDMEDVELGTRLRRRGHRARLLPLVATTSARRFDRAGDIRAVTVAAWLLLRWTILRRVPASDTFFRPVR